MTAAGTAAGAGGRGGRGPTTRTNEEFMEFSVNPWLAEISHWLPLDTASRPLNIPPVPPVSVATMPPKGTPFC